MNQLCSSRHWGWGTELLGLPQPRPPSQVPGVMDTRWLPAIYWALGQRAWRTQPSHTLPACAQKHLSWACGRCDMVTPGPRTGSCLQHALVCVDSCLQLCLPSHAPFLEQPCHRPVCTAQVRGCCREAAKQMIGTQCDVCAIYFFKRSWGYYTWHGNQHKYCANVTCSQVSRVPACLSADGGHTTPHRGRGSWEGHRGCVQDAPMLGRGPPGSACHHSPDPCVARISGTHRACPGRQFVFREEASTEFSEVLCMFAQDGNLKLPAELRVSSEDEQTGVK